ncbi:alpha/beta hydrolase [Mucilaginibacter myungsuensis]|uniref:Esterase family protein n=1 Tax=Mucilaginibacter myungsuensis TaxID=649104 RepID=A0A929KUY5_9SPHI|nr:alpha/beta hydrolase-fold protein [Mucilaginibacter myungsuensis]MBE9662051.1 esterase family protein [Mucilaginibacter myungsuensis]MDN3599516.1 alpha/beta hydrolase-fold protein [Mucilaginibacter myungsuensis]
MKKYLLTAFMALLCSAAALAQTGKVFDNLSVASKILKMERKFAVYLPPDYETSTRDYPVLYLLHGSGDNHTGWVQFGEVLGIADKAIKDGAATPMVIIMPDGDTGRRGYFNDPKGDWNYEDFFFQELMPYVEKKYRIKSQKRFRAISGLSMGGGGTLMYAMHHPELFSSACPLSAYVGPLNVEEAKKNIQRALPNAADSVGVNYYNQFSALGLVAKMPDKDKKAVRWFLDCGDDDFLYEGNALLHIAMTKKAIPHEFRMRDGGHTWTYWRASLPKVLEFVSDAFHQY